MKQANWRKYFSILLLLLWPMAVQAAAIGDLPIEKKQEGSGVVILQQRLADLGYLHFRSTGYFGEMTKTAVQDFQKRNGLSRTGVLGCGHLCQALFPRCGARRGRHRDPPA